MSELRVDRIIPKGGLPSGSYGGIIQVRHSSATDNNTITSSSETTMLTCAITPQRSDSVLWIHVEYPTMRSYDSGDTRNRCNHKIKRNGSDIYAVNETPQYKNCDFGGSGVEINIPVSFSTFDAPNTTSSVTYTSTWQIVSGGGFNTAQATRRMIIFEMSA